MLVTPFLRSVCCVCVCGRRVGVWSININTNIYIYMCVLCVCGRRVGVWSININTNIYIYVCVCVCVCVVCMWAGDRDKWGENM